MSCTYHIHCPISLICIAPHMCKCQRKLCVECQQDHGVDIKQTVPINRFREIAIKELKVYKLDETPELSKQKMAFKSLLSETESMLKKIWDELSEQIKQIYVWIEQGNNSYFNLINENTNLVESSYSDLEQLVQIFKGKTLNDWQDQKNSYRMELDKAQSWWDKEIKAFIEKSNEGIKMIKSIFKIQQGYIWKEDLYEILASIKDIDQSTFSEIFEMLKNKKISDCLGFLQGLVAQQLNELSINQQKQNLYNWKQNIQYIANVIDNIHNHEYNQKDYSADCYKDAREVLMKKISEDQKIITFFKFLVCLTAFDNKFTQCGSNSLHLLVAMKVNLTYSCFEKIKIKNTSLIGANFFRCNFNESEFENVDISGMNLNGSLLFNCKWKNIKIHELNKLKGHMKAVRSVCISPDGTTLASGSNDNSIRLWDVKTGQQKAQLDSHTHYVNSVCFSPDGTTLASGSADTSIRLWDVKTGKEIQPTDKSYKDILAQFNTPLFQNNPLAESVSTNITIMLISQTPIFKCKELQSFKESLSIIKVQICDHYQSQKEVSFWKTKLNQKQYLIILKIILQIHIHLCILFYLQFQAIFLKTYSLLYYPDYFKIFQYIIQKSNHRQ